MPMVGLTPYWSLYPQAQQLYRPGTTITNPTANSTVVTETKVTPGYVPPDTKKNTAGGGTTTGGGGTTTGGTQTGGTTGGTQNLGDVPDWVKALFEAINPTQTQVAANRVPNIAMNWYTAS